MRPQRGVLRVLARLRVVPDKLKGQLIVPHQQLRRNHHIPLDRRAIGRCLRNRQRREQRPVQHHFDVAQRRNQARRNVIVNVHRRLLHHLVLRNRKIRRVERIRPSQVDGPRHTQVEKVLLRAERARHGLRSAGVAARRALCPGGRCPFLRCLLALGVIDLFLRSACSARPGSPACRARLRLRRRSRVIALCPRRTPRSQAQHQKQHHALRWQGLSSASVTPSRSHRPDRHPQSAKRNLNNPAQTPQRLIHFARLAPPQPRVRSRKQHHRQQLFFGHRQRIELQPQHAVRQAHYTRRQLRVARAQRENRLQRFPRDRRQLLQQLHR